MRITTWAVAIIVATVLAIIGGIGFREANKNAQLSCIAAIANTAQALATKYPPVAISQKWRVLSEPEAKALLSKVVPYDCGNSVRRDNTLVDAWGRQFKVALRSGEDGTVFIRVWSVGRDGRSGTDDDLVIPYGDKAITP